MVESSMTATPPAPQPPKKILDPRLLYTLIFGLPFKIFRLTHNFWMYSTIFLFYIGYDVDNCMFLRLKSCSIGDSYLGHFFVCCLFRTARAFFSYLAAMVDIRFKSIYISYAFIKIYVYLIVGYPVCCAKLINGGNSGWHKYWSSVLIQYFIDTVLYMYELSLIE